MIVWKLTYLNPLDTIVEYYSKKKELMDNLVDCIDAEGNMAYKIQKVVVKDSGDLVFQLKIAQGLKLIDSEGR